jgi:cytochrome oxidase Cu insertion factor (SCO1/SenC/PrrC family)
LTTAFIGLLVLAGCAQALPDKPNALVVGAAIPGNWPQARIAAIDAPPRIQAIRLSSTAPRLGTIWDGDILTSTNVVGVNIATNLFNFNPPRTRPGHFHFSLKMIDVPSIFVREYLLTIVARNTAGRERQIVVPFRILPRTAATAYNADARATSALAAPPLVDMNGGSVDLRHDVTVLSFIYTRCPDPRMCPLVTAKFARMAQLLAGTPVRLLEITLDPAHDTPAVLRAYGKGAGADGTRWTLATGQAASLAAFAERAGLYVDRPRAGLILHSDAVLIARDGILEQNVGGNDWSAESVAAEARSIATLPADPIARFALRLVGGVVEVCGGAIARGVTPAVLLMLVAAGIVLVAAAGLFAGRRRLRARFARR